MNDKLSTDELEALDALGQPGRMSVFRLLARRAPDAVSAGELAQALGLKPSTLSVYVGILLRAGLIRSTREGRSIRYAIELDRVGALVDYLVNDCCRGRPELFSGLAQDVAAPWRSDASSQARPFNVLFVCTRNSARSIFAEAILRAAGSGRFSAFSAGTDPQAEINGVAAEILLAKGHDISTLKPKNISVFHDVSAPKMDFVFTVCDQAANEECPPLLGQPVSAHWGMVDPVKAEGSIAERSLAFHQAYQMLQRRLEAFMALPLSSLTRLSLQHALDRIGQE